MHSKEPFKLLDCLGVLLILSAQVALTGGYSIYLPATANYATSKLLSIALDPQRQHSSAHQPFAANAPNKDNKHHKYVYSVESVDPHDAALKLNASHWIDLDSQTGRLALREELRCSSGKLDELTPRPLKLIVQALQYSLAGPTARTVQLLRFPLEIYFDHATCEPLALTGRPNARQLESQLAAVQPHYESSHDCETCVDDFRRLSLSTEHLALIQQVNNRPQENCFHHSQYLTNLNQLVPAVFRQQCRPVFKLLARPTSVNSRTVELAADGNNNKNELLVELSPFEENADKFKIQRNLNDLIASHSHCHDKDVFNLSVVLMINCDKDAEAAERSSVVLLSSKQLIDIVLAKANNVQLTADGVSQFLHQRNHEIRHSNRPKLKNYLDSIQNDLQLILDKSYLIDELKETAAAADANRRSKRELKSNNQVSSPYFDRKFYIVNVPEEQEKGKFNLLNSINLIQLIQNTLFNWKLTRNFLSLLGYIVTTLTAKNQNPNQQIVYSMSAVLDARSQSMFKIDESTGLITTTTKLDREFMSVHYLKVFAAELAVNGQEDQANQTVQKSAQLTLQVNVVDVNDHSPIFEKTNYEAVISESQPVNSNVLAVRATDLDAGPNAELEYSISQISVCNNGQIESGNQKTSKELKEIKETFKIDAKSGVIKTNVQLDRETIACYELLIQVNDLAQPGMRKSSATRLVVKIEDANDCYPQFSNKSYSVSIREDINFNEKPLIIQIKATDDDEGLNAVLRYSIISGELQFFN